MPFLDAKYPVDRRLVQAAPDLLDALRQCLKVVNAHRAVSGGDGDLSALLARCAIDAATGEDN